MRVGTQLQVPAREPMEPMSVYIFFVGLFLADFQGFFIRGGHGSCHTCYAVECAVLSILSISAPDVSHSYTVYLQAEVTLIYRAVIRGESPPAAATWSQSKLLIFVVRSNDS